MTAHENRDFSNRDITAILEGDGFVANSWAFNAWQFIGLAAAEPFSPNQSRSGDGNVFKSFAEDKAVGPVVVSEILISFPRLRRSGRVVAARRRAFV